MVFNFLLKNKLIIFLFRTNKTITLIIYKWILNMIQDTQALLQFQQILIFGAELSNLKKNILKKKISNKI